MTNTNPSDELSTWIKATVDAGRAEVEYLLRLADEHRLAGCDMPEVFCPGEEVLERVDNASGVILLSALEIIATERRERAAGR